MTRDERKSRVFPILYGAKSTPESIQRALKFIDEVEEQPNAKSNAAGGESKTDDCHIKPLIPGQSNAVQRDG